MQSISNVTKPQFRILEMLMKVDQDFEKFEEKVQFFKIDFSTHCD